MSILEADDLFRFYHPGDTEVRALRGASLDVKRGEIVALVGPSGSGKSTLLACIAGLDEPDGGTVTINGQRMTRRPEAERALLRASSIGFLAQSGNLFAHLTIAQNIEVQLDLSGRSRNAARILELLNLVGLAERADAMPSTLSGGEAARAGLAVALAADPPLLIADEPTAEVDAETEARILDVLEARRTKGGAALIATHSSSLSMQASRIVTIADGRIVEGIGPIVAKSGARQLPTQAIQRDRVVPVVLRSKGTSVLIEARGAARGFAVTGQRIEALRPTDCALFARQRVALTGPSGSGKSTLLNLLAGLEDPSAGDITWPGLDTLRPLRPQQIGFLFQSPSLVPSLTVVENVRLPLDIAGHNRVESMDPNDVLALFSLSDLSNKLPDQLSGGQMQRVALARALVMRPKVLFADEPTGQLDHATGQEVMRVLLGVLAGGDTALVVATHDPSVANLMDEHWYLDAGTLTTRSNKGAAA